tara:strand:- start:12665 stop:14608 length:1944 start_codon:yes stop_codon:yes gene_type:complete
MDLQAGFQLGEWIVLPGEGTIQNTTTTRNVRRKAMDVLVVLANSSGQVVEREAILSSVWGAQAVSDEPLTTTIAELRRLLKGETTEPYIQTAPKRGYRLIAAVQSLAQNLPESETSEPTKEQPEPSTEYRQTPIIQINRFSIAALLLILIAIVSTLIVMQPAAPGPIHDRSIAVLPFENLSQSSHQNYLAEGLAEELTTLLTGVPQLKIAAKNSSFSAYHSSISGSANDSSSAPELNFTAIAADLNVAYVLTGGIRVNGNQLRVTAQLIDSTTGYQKWSGSFDRTMADLFDIQVDIATQITEQLELNLVGAGAQPVKPTSEAYRLYLQARYVAEQHTQTSFENAVTLYQQALALDADYAPAWSELAGLYVNMVGFSLLPREEGFRLANEAAFRALAIDPENASAHDRLGWIALHADSNLRSAAAHYNHALALEPANNSIISNAAVLAIALGQLDTAILLFERVATADPVSPVSHANLSNAYMLNRQYPEAEQSIRNALTLSPQYAAGHYRLLRALLPQHKVEAAAQVIEDEPFEAARFIGKAFLYNKTGDLTASDAALASVQALYGDAAAGNYAQVMADRGDVENAFRYLEIEYNVNGLAGFLEFHADPVFARMKSDPRWISLMQRIGMSSSDLRTIKLQIPAKAIQ